MEAYYERNGTRVLNQIQETNLDVVRSYRGSRYFLFDPSCSAVQSEEDVLSKLPSRWKLPTSLIAILISSPLSPPTEAN
jgi:hypothetical protein